MTKIPLFPWMATNLVAIDYLPVFSLFPQLVLCKKFPFWKDKVFHSVFAGFEYTSWWVKCNKIIINLQLCSDFKIYFPNYKKGIESLFTLIWFTSHCLSITTLKKKKLFLSESASCSVVSDSLRLHGLSMEFSRPEYWMGMEKPFPSPGDLPNPGIKPRSPELQVYSFTSWATREAQALKLWEHHFKKASFKYQLLLWIWK